MKSENKSGKTYSLAFRKAMACETQGVHTANAMFVYADPTEPITEPITDPDKLYNGLSYIGLFDD